MTLEELIEGLGVEHVRGDLGVEVTGLAYDSRQVEPGALFFCVRGLESDGHEFAADAVERGAVGLVVERDVDVSVPQVRVPDARATMAPLASRFHGDPNSELELIGITGTNGKTTTAFLVRGILEGADRPTGLLGTVRRIVGGQEEEVERTTPEAIDLQATLRRMHEEGDEACVMEVSSHALALHRTEGLRFDVAVFTNLTQDHLDFHSDMEDYFAAKRLLFASGPETAVVNIDDDFGRRLAGEFDCMTFSATGGAADYTATDVEVDASGSRFTCSTSAGDVRVEIDLPGDFNVANALAAIAASDVMGIPPDSAAASLAQAARVPGRLEPVDEGQPFAVLVDYAHTPDSLQSVLGAARRLTEGRLICVFGCGGDRDRGKRPLMGRIAADLSDLPVVTSDNPRSEDPRAIVEEIVAGPGADGVEVEVDRRAAIALALGRAERGDVVLIAGKGHEQGQEFEDGRKVPFDDRQVAAEELRRLKTGAGST